MTSSPNLGLPFLNAEQALKTQTHNTALQRLDALVQMTADDRDRTAPPGAPEEGDRHIVAAGATGAWSGADGAVAAWQNGAWVFYPPSPGWRAWLAGEAALIVFDGSDWVPATASLPLCGVNTTADATNRLAVKSDAVLLSHDDVTPGSGDIQMKLNKASAGDTASVLFQDNWSGRAEFGLSGDDNWHVKVSPDGTTWLDALVVEAATGRVSFPQGGPRIKLSAALTLYVNGTTGSDTTGTGAVGAPWATLQKAMDVIAAEYDLGACNITVSVAAGTYTGQLSLKTYVTSGGRVIFNGDTTTPANCTISRTGHCIAAANAGIIGNFTIQGFKLTTTTSGDGFYIQGINLAVTFGVMEFGACAGAHGESYGGALVTKTGHWHISGGAVIGFWASRNGTMLFSGSSFYYHGTVAYSARNFNASERGWIDAWGVTFDTATYSGTVTGKRFEISGQGAIFTNSGGASYIPGSIAGTTDAATFGLYY